MAFARGAASLRRLIAVAACALAAHALVYRSLMPAGAAHGYFGWYEPAVAVATAVSLLGLLVALALAALSRADALPFAAFRLPPKPFGAIFGELFPSTFVFLLLQESLERSVVEGRPAAAALRPATALMFAAAAALVACVLAFARRLGQATVRLLLGARTRPVRATTAAPSWRVVVSPVLRLRPLAEHLALRGPPYSFA